MKAGLITTSGLFVGVTRYEESLIDGLNKIGVEIDKIILNKKEIRVLFLKETTLLVTALNQFYILLSRYLFSPKEKYDVYHASSQFTAIRNVDVVTVHDVIGLKNIPEIKETIGILEKGLWLTCLPLIRKAKKIIAISEATKNDLIKIAGFKENKIRVIYRNVDENRFYPSKDKNLREKLLNSLLFVGELKMYKNVQLVLRAMNILKEKYKEEYKFIIIGKESRGSMEWWNKYSDFISKNKLNVEWLKNIDDEMLRKYYSNVDLFLWPSLYEGFGLPPLEAMTCGTNVVCLDNKINREVLQDKAFYSKNDAEEFAKTIRRAIEEKKPEKELIAHAKKFNWEKTAKETKEVYEEIK